VHFAAGLRLLLGEEAAPETVMAYTAQVQDYLPPLDTVHAVIRTKSGAIGTFSISVGTTLSDSTWDVACERGSVSASTRKVTVVKASEEGGRSGKTVTHVEEFASTSGVKEEVRAWAEGLVQGRPNPLQAPELALGDLELLEKIFRSGEQGGASLKLEYL
jgi:predicted dehydrogenase